MAVLIGLAAGRHENVAAAPARVEKRSVQIGAHDFVGWSDRDRAEDDRAEAWARGRHESASAFAVTTRCRASVGCRRSWQELPYTQALENDAKTHRRGGAQRHIARGVKGWDGG
jgi:hypothetical protein